jgi:hypothetical protein
MPSRKRALNSEYLEWVDKLLFDSPFVNEVKTHCEDRGEVWFLRVNVFFIDNSLLHFRELFVGQESSIKKATPSIISAPMARWCFGTITHRTFRTYPPRRIINISGRMM